MRRLWYSVAMSLDGAIAGPDGEFDWIPEDPEIDFPAMFARFDAVIMGRRSFEVARKYGLDSLPGGKPIVVSRTLQAPDCPDAILLNDNVLEAVAGLKRQPGKDLWLYGGGVLFRDLLDAGLVDVVEVAVVPALIGGGIPILPDRQGRTRLRLLNTRTFDRSGIVLLRYEVEQGGEGALPADPESIH